MNEPQPASELIYVCNSCAHMWQDNAEGVQRCEHCHVANVAENIYTFEVYVADYAADWSQRVMDAVVEPLP